MFSIDYLFDLCMMTTIKGSVLIFIILGSQRFFKKDFTAKWIYTLWSLVIIRLLVPNTPLENVLSLYNLGLVKRLKFNINDVILGRLGVASDHFDIIGKTVSTPSFIKKAFAFDLEHFIAVTWLVGIIILLLFFCHININIFRLFKNAHHCKDKEILQIIDGCKDKIKLKKKIKLYISSDVASPMTYDFIFPKIIIPREILTHLTPKELEYIFLHELVHIKRGDVLFNVLGMLVCIIHWYNPLVWVVFFRSKKDCELACDETVLQYLNDREYNRYGLTLIQMLELTLSPKMKDTLVTKSLVNDRSEANARVIQISRFKRKRKSVIAFSFFLILIIGIIGLNEDTSTRPSISYNTENLYEYLDDSYHEVRVSFDINPVHTYLLRMKDSAYFILYYNILGEKVQFWYDGNDSKRKKTLEITTTGYKGIRQGMAIKKAQEQAIQNHLTFIDTEKTKDFTAYIYEDSRCHVMVIEDSSTHKVYSVTLY